MTRTTSDRRWVILALACTLCGCALPRGAAAQDRATVAQGRYATHLLASINAYRVQHGLPALAAAAALDGLAQEHSKAMAKAARMSHDGFPDRVARSGNQVCVENVGWNYAGPDAQLRAWIDSPVHNRNLLDPKVAAAGIGEEKAYVTFMGCR